MTLCDSDLPLQEAPVQGRRVAFNLIQRTTSWPGTQALTARALTRMGPGAGSYGQHLVNIAGISHAETVHWKLAAPLGGQCVYRSQHPLPHSTEAGQKLVQSKPVTEA